MKLPRKSATVSKKLTDEIVTNSSRWTTLLKMSIIHWDSLTEECKDFYYLQGDINTPLEELNKAIDEAAKSMED